MADAIVVNCEFVRQHLRNNEGVPGERIRLCYNGVDLEEFAPRETPRDSLTIGVVCALRPEKDVGTLIDAFARVRRPGLRLLIVGSGSMLGELRSQAAASRLGRRLHLRSGYRKSGRVAAGHRHFRFAVAIGGAV